ncbi:MAG: DMT family transporter [Ignavibacteriales bacterium]|nr:DMT family transporter [Ignavibacteriales bacterium]
MKKYYGEGALLLNTLIWGGTFAIVKNAFNDVSPLLFLSLRFIIATLLFLPFVYKHLLKVDKKTILAGVVLGVFYFSGFATQTLGLNITTATKSGFITGTFVIFIPLLQLIIERRKPKWFNIVSVLLVLIGLVMLASKGDNAIDFIQQLGTDFNFGDILTLLCAILFAFQVVYVDIFTKRYNYLPMVFVQLLITGLGGLVFSFIFSISELEALRFDLNSSVIASLIYTAIFASIIATIIQLKFQKIVSPTKAGIIFSIEPIFAAVFAFFLLSEKISNFGLIGCAIIFIGLVLSEFFENKFKDE